MKITAQQLSVKLNGKKVGSGWVARCPAHDDKNPSLSINSKGDGTFLAKCLAGCPQEKLFVALREIGAFGDQKSVLDNEFLDPTWKKLWDESVGLRTKPNPARRYLKIRGLGHSTKSESLRFCERTYYSGKKGTRYLPAMICAIKDVNGMLSGVQRIYLTENGEKQAFKDNKKILGSLRENSVHLGEPKKALSVTEGVETGLAIREATGMAVWAALSANNLIQLTVPSTVEEIHIWADADENGTGVAAAEELSLRLQRQGKKVLIHHPPTDPSDAPKSFDWLDVYADGGEKPIKESFENIKSEKIVTGWSPPVTFSRKKLPKLPLKSLPLIFRRFAKELSQQLDVCHNMIFMHILGMLSICSARVFKIQLKKGWVQPANIFLLTPMLSGQKKSQVVREVFTPVYNWEKKMSDNLKEEIKEAKSTFNNQQATLTGLRGRLGKKNSDDD